MKQLIANSIMKFVILSLLKFTIVCCTGGGATDPVDEFTMVNEFDQGTDRDGTLDNETRFGALLAGTSDTSAEVSCGGVYKRLQNEVLSPGYPEEYGHNLHCEYTFKSPYICSVQYHFQFLEFSLEPSRDCAKDRLVIGDDEVLCGSVLGSKRYDTVDGVLHMKFVTDGWGSRPGFRILVTRLPCDDNEAAESSTAFPVYTTIQVTDEVTDETTAGEDEPPKDVKVVSSRQDIPPEFNPGGNGYLPPTSTIPPTYYPPPPTSCYPQCSVHPVCPPASHPYFPSNPRFPCHPVPPNCSPAPVPQNPIPQYPSYPSYPSIPSYNPYNPQYPSPYPSYPNYPYYPTSPPSGNYPSYPTDGGTTSIGGAPPGYQPSNEQSKPEFPEEHDPHQPESQVAVYPGYQPCCRNAFTQRRFYLSSANFPSYQSVNQDCTIHINRFSPATCRLVIRFKFFLHGNARLGCADGFIEIDGNRLCGCRTGQHYTSSMAAPAKIIRVHSVAGRHPSAHGFVLDVSQEECNSAPGVPWKRSIDRLALLDPSATQYEVSKVEGQQLLPAKFSAPLRSFYFYNFGDARPAQRNATQLAKFINPTVGYPSHECDFSSLDWIRLKLDWMWNFKPICVA